jgi:metal-responsive CopG/Arc/MetJ family transcriptional regulator
MKVKTSISLPPELLLAVDRMSAAYNSRSAFIEAALRAYVARKQPAADNELARINQYATQLNREALDVLDYQIDL